MRIEAHVMGDIDQDSVVPDPVSPDDAHLARFADALECLCDRYGYDIVGSDMTIIARAKVPPHVRHMRMRKLCESVLKSLSGLSGAMLHIDNGSKKSIKSLNKVLAICGRFQAKETK